MMVGGKYEKGEKERNIERERDIMYIDIVIGVFKILINIIF